MPQSDFTCHFLFPFPEPPFLGELPSTLSIFLLSVSSVDLICSSTFFFIFFISSARKAWIRVRNSFFAGDSSVTNETKFLIYQVIFFLNKDILEIWPVMLIEFLLAVY